MKLSKRILSIALCAVMLLGLSISALAAGGTEKYTLTIDNSKTGHTYEAYQLFKGKLTDDGTKQILSDIEWGASVIYSGTDKSEALKSAIDAEPKLHTLSSAETAKELADALSGFAPDSEELDLFAKVVGKVLDNPVGTVDSPIGGKYVISNLDAGYYLVRDKSNTLVDAENDFHTRFILRVVKNVEVKPKGDIPSVDKTINDTLDGTYSDYEDFDIADTAYYKWTGKLPSNLKNYTSYFYKFTDKLPAGIVFEDIEQIYIEGHDGNKVHTFVDKTDATTENDALPTGIELDTTPTATDDWTFAVQFNDLITLYPNLLATHKIVVKYSATVTRDADIGKPMDNSVKLEYSNDPYGEGHGITPEDKAYAFTFGIMVDKYDADAPDKKLEGAEFVLYYERIKDGNLVKYYAKVITEEMIANGETVNGKAVVADDLGVVYEWTDKKSEAAILDTDKDGNLYVKGLDSGIY